MSIQLYWQKYRYFPYEKKLAELEVLRLTGTSPQAFSEGLQIEESSDAIPKLCRSTYFRSLEVGGRETHIPIQAQLEASTNGHTDKKSKHQKRQITRYSAHGLHEYRGKFNPQIVRLIGNIIGIKHNDWILDPFCGSGTTLLEAFHNGWNAVGIDRNPLAVQIANAKIAAVSMDQASLDIIIKSLSQALLPKLNNVTFQQTLTKSEITKIAGSHWQKWLPNFEYLQKWFIPDVLIQFSAIFQAIDTLQSEQQKLIATVILSDLVREASLQDPSDLRIRRRKEFPETYDVIHLYMITLEEKITTIIKAKQCMMMDGIFQAAHKGDVRSGYNLLKQYAPKGRKKGFDGAITSPPYATGLPYVDTDRLSLVLLGLIQADDIHDTQKSLIGNREISKQERDNLLLAIDENRAGLPERVIAFCRELKQAVGKKDGFRRQNVPGVIYKYFAEMGESFGQVRKLLQEGAPYALVVGMNSTTLGGTKFVIDTPKMLIEIALHSGFELAELIELDTYQRYDIHQANSIRSEYLIILKAM